MILIEELLMQDVDDLTRLATTSEIAARVELLRLATRELSRPNLRHRYKLIGFIQALAALDEGDLEADASELAASALISIAHGDDPEDRLGALRALAVVTVNTERASEALARSILSTFEEARNDSSADIREHADEVLSAGNDVFRVLMSHLPGPGERSNAARPRLTKVN